jgi:phosphatidylglycerol:prolipoprotein diacylglycerol transferase
VKFPQALLNPHTEEASRFYEAAQAATAADPSLVPSFAAMQSSGSWPAQKHFFEQMLAAGRDNPLVNQAIAPFLEPRHPSQLYEGLLEGLLLFVILLGLRLRFPRLPHGVLTGLFFILYAVFRISMEEYRLPDSALMAFDLTKGQFLSVFMLLAGAGFLGAGILGARRVSHEGI